MAPKSIPAYHDLPLNKGDPPHSAWGLWGDGDQLGALNYLTDELVARTVKEEVKSGERVGLDMPLDMFNPVPAGKERLTFKKNLVDYAPIVVNDDVITMNTQSSSQWDSFRHFAYQNEKMFYGGVTQAMIHDPSNPSPANGLQPWTERGIAGRAILIDYAAWADSHGKKYEVFGRHGITVDEIEAVAKEQNLHFQQGDILIVRTGYSREYPKLDAAGRQTVSDKRAWIGLEQSEKMQEWLWSRQFAAVAADCPGFETRPRTDEAWELHPVLLAGWGTPIGELFDLERLSAACKKNKRWSFFMTSAPLNYSGAVASPPNAIAIF